MNYSKRLSKIATIRTPYDICVELNITPEKFISRSQKFCDSLCRGNIKEIQDELNNGFMAMDIIDWMDGQSKSIKEVYEITNYGKRTTPSIFMFPMYFASVGLKYNVIKFLLECGASPELISHSTGKIYRHELIFKAVKADYLKLVQLLIEYGALKGLKITDHNVYSNSSLLSYCISDNMKELLIANSNSQS